MSTDIIPSKLAIFHGNDFTNKAKRGNMLITLFGSINCGIPNFIDDNREGMIEIPKKMLGSGDYFALRAKGDSMINAGIQENDILIIRMQNYADDGQIVVARIDQDVALKRLFRLDSDKMVLLHSENEKYNDIRTDDCDILGVAVKIIKNIEEN